MLSCCIPWVFLFSVLKNIKNIIIAINLHLHLGDSFLSCEWLVDWAVTRVSPDLTAFGYDSLFQLSGQRVDKSASLQILIKYLCVSRASSNVVNGGPLHYI